MKQVTIGQLRREGSLENIRDWMPCVIISDGEPVAALVEYSDDGFPPPDSVSDAPVVIHRKTSQTPSTNEHNVQVTETPSTSSAVEAKSESPKVLQRSFRPLSKKAQAHPGKTAS